MNKPTKPKCPRCKSARVEMRLSGVRFCKRCGQSWHSNGLLVRSFDRRTLKGAKPAEQEQLPLTVIK